MNRTKFQFLLTFWVAVWGASMILGIGRPDWSWAAGGLAAGGALVIFILVLVDLIGERRKRVRR